MLTKRKVHSIRYNIQHHINVQPDENFRAIMLDSKKRVKVHKKCTKSSKNQIKTYTTNTHSKNHAEHLVCIAYRARAVSIKNISIFFLDYNKDNFKMFVSHDKNVFVHSVSYDVKAAKYCIDIL